MARHKSINPAWLLQRLRCMHLHPVRSSGVRRLGYDPASRMAAVLYPATDVVYGYPNLSDEELQGLLEVLQHLDDHSLGHYVSTVIKARHEHEHLRWDSENG
ncbi:hypothetical protein [uncultured Ramlibacter sp.]|uniref:hypothetical protein n=1 Tax=uncultured Ramlibacter sp. TaxID=260755 RepID=UPI00260889F3|nr:hypothetical protein [uncultured Ramlibacter sp.]